MVRMSKIQEEIYKRFLLLMQENCGDQLNPIKIFAICSKVNSLKALFLFYRGSFILIYSGLSVYIHCFTSKTR